ncbi:hypothetical protein [Anaerofustis stercorihominis]|uniref:Type 4 fimbrial biogenesis protein PilX N-terminal domain-containing protein n=1 Tax=Anaerofustis stercorihominis TaxID=214853 RepID=A0A3E3E1C9_9FIRM|nr:hypothetical protein [Anaerofustis stercorihominis]RGD75347.1 hypothetical protein DW687_03200 [Anaerofustis stercorihominis]
MKRNNSNEYGINIGSSTLIMIFALLCLVVFSLLAYKTALNEKNLALKISNETKAYYEADYKATKIKNKIENNITNGKSIASLVDYEKSRNGSNYIGYSVKIDENKKLSVELRRSGSNLKVVKWTEVNEASEDYNNKLDVWGGELGD